MSYAVPCGEGRHRGDRGAATAPAGPSTSRPLHLVPAPRRSPGRRAVSLLANALVLVAVLLFLLVAVGPHLFGYRTSTMLTGSMSPGIKPGDVVVTVPKPATELRVGDVISYHIPVEDHRVETHRVTRIIHGQDGSIAIRTKGDANGAVDPWKATLEGDTVWVSKAVVPKLGTVIHTLREPAFRQFFFWIALAGVVLLGLTRIWAKPARDEDAEAQAVIVTSLEDEVAARERAARRATAAAMAAAGALSEAAADPAPRRSAGVSDPSRTAARAASVAVSSLNEERAREQGMEPREGDGTEAGPGGRGVQSA
jgi:signal peptidase